MLQAIPLERWDIEASLLGESASDMCARFGGTLLGVDLADAAAYQLSSTEAVLMDPQQRLLLDALADSLIGTRYRQVCYHAKPLQ